MINPPYDTDTQMYKDAPRELDMEQLRFLRWLGERGLLEHQIEGSPCGDLTDTPCPPSRE